MKTLKSTVLVLVLAAAAFAGCPAPGETSTPPCTVAQPTGDSTAIGETSSTPTADSVDIVSIGEILFDMLTLY
jgi:hypothetical protein